MLAFLKARLLRSLTFPAEFSPFLILLFILLFELGLGLGLAKLKSLEGNDEGGREARFGVAAVLD